MDPNEAPSLASILLQLCIFFMSIIVNSFDTSSEFVDSSLLHKNDPAADTPPRNIITPTKQI
jgi:hypothetical protein